MRRHIGLVLGFFILVFPILSFGDTSPSSDMKDWCVKKMISWAPPGRKTLRDAEESKSEAISRYESIATDAISVAFDPEEAPLFTGSNNRARTLATMLSFANIESGGFRRDVDYGVGAKSRGDNGRSWCLMQIMLGRPDPKGNTPNHVFPKGTLVGFSKRPNVGWSGTDLVNDRQKCFRIGLRMLRTAQLTCPYLPVSEKFASYISGNCHISRDSSSQRVSLAREWFRNEPPPVEDEDVISDLIKFSPEFRSTFVSIDSSF